MERALVLTDTTSKTLSYEELSSDIHTLLFNYLLTDLSDTETIQAAKQLGATCKRQHELFFNAIKESFKTFIFATIDYNQYKINNRLCNFYITMLPTDYYLSFIENTEKQKDYVLSQLIFIENHNYLSEENINNSIKKNQYAIVKQQKNIADLTNEIKNTDVKEKPLMIKIAEEHLCALHISLYESEAEKKINELDLNKIKTREKYKEELTKQPLFNIFYTQSENNSLFHENSYKDFNCWINAKIHLIYLFCVRTLFQPLLYTEGYYNEHANLISMARKNLDNNNTIITKIATQIDHYITKQKIVELAIDMLLNNISEIRDNHFPFKNYINLSFFSEKNDKKVTITLPHYAYGLNNNNICINLDWIDALYTLYQNIYDSHQQRRLEHVLLYIKSATTKTNVIQLTSQNKCTMKSPQQGIRVQADQLAQSGNTSIEQGASSYNIQYNMHKLMKYINKKNPLGSKITIKTTNGVNHFTEHNKRFLYCVQNNQYPNITFEFQTPKEKIDNCKTFFTKKSMLNWYYTIYYINEDIHNGRSVWLDYFCDKNDELFEMKHFVLILSIIALCAQQENQSTVFSYSILLPIVQILGILSTKIETATSFKKIIKKTISIIPWYIIHALLVDTLLIYSIYQYHNINYLVAAYALFEFCMVQKSLFHKPLFKNLYNQYTAKNTVSVVTY